MKRLILFVAAVAFVLTSCATSSVKTTIEGRFVANEPLTLSLERISDNYDTVDKIAEVELPQNGEFEFKFGMERGLSPRLYRLSFSNGMRPITLVVAPGDDIYIDSLGNLFLNYKVEGSEESALIESFNKEYYAAVDKLATLSQQMALAENNILKLNEEAYRAAEEAMRVQLRFVGSHPSSIAAFYATRQQVVEEYVPMLRGKGISTPHLQSLKEGLTKAYPESPYIALLEREIANVEALVELASNLQQTSYPDIELDDMYKKMHRLSELDGKVVLLYFWSAQIPLCNSINAELKTLYERYHDKGFEVYHVSADENRALWIEATRAQEHPWISVFGSTDPTVFSLYAVYQVPMAYIISRDGTINICPLESKELEKQIKKRL